MNEKQVCDAIVVGAGPNGLAAAITLARAGRSVRVLEANDQIGGGVQSSELTLPGFTHDTCSTVYPLALAAPFFRSLPLAEYGLEWVHPPAPMAHPLDDGASILLERSIDATAAGLGEDAGAYRRLMQPLATDWDMIARQILGPLRLPRDPIALARFGWYAIRPGRRLAETLFRAERARALLAGLAAHSILPLEQPPSAAFALVMGITGHVVGWPFARGGAQKLADALAGYLRSLGGEIVTGARVDSIDQLSPTPMRLLDVTPRQLLRIATCLPSGYRRKLERFRHGPGVFKVDWALDAPIPWSAEECLRAGVVHIGGTLEEIAASERAVWQGKTADKPFVILAQPTLFDASRAPEGKHIGWAYCHVPNGSTEDMTERIEEQIERFAPGFRDRILARSVMPPRQLEQHNANYVGGDIAGGVMSLSQLFTRPTLQWNPYATPLKGIYLCSSSTPPGGGVHGMCGYYAACAAMGNDA